MSIDRDDKLYNLNKIKQPFLAAEGLWLWGDCKSLVTQLVP